MSFMDNSLNAFQTAAGISPDKMSFFIRSLLLVLIFLWATWCVYGKVTHFRCHDIEMFDVFQAIFRIAIVIVFVMVLVFVG